MTERVTQLLLDNDTEWVIQVVQERREGGGVGSVRDLNSRWFDRKGTRA